MYVRWVFSRTGGEKRERGIVFSFSYVVVLCCADLHFNASSCCCPTLLPVGLHVCWLWTLETPPWRTKPCALNHRHVMYACMQVSFIVPHGASHTVWCCVCTQTERVPLCIIIRYSPWLSYIGECFWVINGEAHPLRCLCITSSDGKQKRNNNNNNIHQGIRCAFSTHAACLCR